MTNRPRAVGPVRGFVARQVPACLVSRWAAPTSGMSTNTSPWDSGRYGPAWGSVAEVQIRRGRIRHPYCSSSSSGSSSQTSSSPKTSGSGSSPATTRASRSTDGSPIEAARNATSSMRPRLEQLVGGQALRRDGVQQPVLDVDLATAEVLEEPEQQTEASTVADAGIREHPGAPATERLAFDLEQVGQQLVAEVGQHGDPRGNVCDGGVGSQRVEGGRLATRFHRRGASWSAAGALRGQLAGDGGGGHGGRLHLGPFERAGSTEHFEGRLADGDPDEAGGDSRRSKCASRCACNTSPISSSCTELSKNRSDPAAERASRRTSEQSARGGRRYDHSVLGIRSK